MAEKKISVSITGTAVWVVRCEDCGLTVAEGAGQEQVTAAVAAGMAHRCADQMFVPAQTTRADLN